MQTQRWISLFTATALLALGAGAARAQDYYDPYRTLREIHYGGDYRSERARAEREAWAQQQQQQQVIVVPQAPRERTLRDIHQRKNGSSRRR